MPLVQRVIPINFARGLDTKTDPKQVQMGKFLSLENTVFDKGGLLLKRNGFGNLTSLPSGVSATFLTTLNDNLTAISNTISAYSSSTSQWVNKGTFQPMEVNTLPLIRNSINQTQCDAAVSPNGLVCTVYTETNAGTTSYKYAVANSITGQNIVSPVAIPVSSGAVTGSPRVFLLGNYFVIVFTNVISAVSHLQYISISVNNPTTVTSNQDIASIYISSPTLSWDGVVAGSSLFIGYNTTSGGQAIKVTFLSASQAASGSLPATAVTFAGRIATMMSLTADTTNPSDPIIYVSFYDSAGSTGYTLAVDKLAHTILSPTQIISSGTLLNITSAAKNGVCTVFTEVSNNYSYDSSIPTHYINGITITQGGSVGSSYVVIRSVGLASKAFIVDGVIYFLSAYQSTFQPSYFLINGSTSVAAAPKVVAKLAYENGGGYLTLGLPNVSVSSSGVAQVSYLFKDLIEALSTLGNSQQTTAGGIYSQTGIKLGTFTIGTQGLDSAEIAGDLHLSGGFLWMYDGYLPVEHSFFVWPDNVELSAATTGGGMLAQQYFYQAVYEWEDNQGNIFRSAPSIPVSVTTTAGSALTPKSIFSSGASSIVVSSATGLFIGQIITDTTTPGNIQSGTTITSISGTTIGLSLPTSGSSAASPGDDLSITQTASVTVNVPTYRLTYKISNSAKIVIYRWSTAQQEYFQVTSITSAQLNSTTTDSIAFVDTKSDQAISGNSLIYTTGGVLEDVNAPASNIITLFDTRLWLVDAEDQNLLWFSKPVIESTPVEMSDLQTMFIPPTTAAQGSTGPITALAPMDDKLIIFKNNAIYYINGKGPDITGANNQYSQPVFITSTVGCSNQQSIVFMPNGLMFQSQKGIWLLGRDLSTTYIGASVEEFNDSVVQSAANIPSTNQVRFTLNSGQQLMYDYFYDQWGTFVGASAISSCIYNGKHTLLDSFGRVLQETPGIYLDSVSPVLLSFTTGHIQFQGISGYQRIFEIQLLGEYITPHLLNVELGYDFAALSEQALITPTNATGIYGSDPIYGMTSPYGGPGVKEQWRIQPSTQKCQAFQLKISEIYDPSFNVPAGAGFTLSAFTCVLGLNRGYRPVKAANTIGTS